MSKTLVMIRHAHRDTSRREADDGLDEKGVEQAKSLRRFFQARFNPDDLSRGLWLVSSPKIRCQETLAPIAKLMDRPIDTHPGLDEQIGREPAPAFLARIEGFLAEWRQSKVETTVLCSHGDWLPAASLKLLGLGLEMKKGSWLELEWENGSARLKWYIPGFKPFYS